MEQRCVEYGVAGVLFSGGWQQDLVLEVPEDEMEHSLLIAQALRRAAAMWPSASSKSLNEMLAERGYRARIVSSCRPEGVDYLGWVRHIGQMCYFLWEVEVYLLLEHGLELYSEKEVDTD